MQTQIHIVQYCNPDGTAIENSPNKIIEASKLKDIRKTRNGAFGKIDVRVWDNDYDDGSYSIESQSVMVKHTFAVMTTGQFIRNTNDTSTLNAHTMSGGFGQINRLAFQWSATIIEVGNSYSLWERNQVWSDSGIRPTTFDMYSYHINHPKQEYLESRLEWEVWESLDLENILSDYLQKSDIRDSKLDKLGL